MGDNAVKPWIFPPPPETLAMVMRLSKLDEEQVRQAQWNVYAADASLFANRVILRTLRYCMLARVGRRAA